MKSTLHEGRYDALNIYIQSDQNRFGGKGTFPIPNLLPGNPLYKIDGVIVQASTLQGKSPGSSYDQRKTTIHEVGHWMFLLHPFEPANGDPCVVDGDIVPDTPFQLTATTGCPADNTKHSCPFKLLGLDPGFDSIHSYMDYFDDTCRTLFTRDQITRMTQSFNGTRRGR
jgi:hypothetical protein